MKQLEILEEQVKNILSKHQPYKVELNKHFWRKKVSNTYNNTLLQFVDIFGFELINLTMIEFNEEISEDSDYYYFGNFEADYLVLNKRNGKVQMVDYDRRLIFSCCKSGDSFLDFFLNEIDIIDPDGSLSDEEFQQRKENKYEECLEICGGFEYKDWMDMLYQ